MMTLALNDILWTCEDAAAATAGKTSAPWAAGGVSIDSCSLLAGDLFVAIRGERFDGHDFAAAALAAGAAAAIIDHDIGLPGPCLLVDDTMQALRDLGVAARRRAAARVIAVTGSVGKTGTKDALNLVLSRQGRTYASAGSLNNHWGLPLSLSRMPPQAAFGVFEMGMNHAGEIAPLSKMARPHVALITTVEDVHSAYFDDVGAIAEAKAEIFAGLEPGGVAVLNRDNEQFHRLAEAAGRYGVDRVIGFGLSEDAEFRLIEEIPGPDGSSLRLDFDGQIVDYRLAVAGHHWAVNSVGVLAAVAAAGGDVGQAALALAEMTALPGRGLAHRLTIAGRPYTLIDESYNASPVSMDAAFAVLGRTPTGPGGRRIAVLGEMLELGVNSAKRHAGLADSLLANGIDLIFTAGGDMAHLDDAVEPSMRGGHGENATALLAMVQTEIGAGDVVMVKGSNGSRMGAIVAALLAESGSSAVRPARVVNGQ